MALFSSKKKISVAIIDIRASSIGGAYALYETGQPPALYYTIRHSVEPHANESIVHAVERTLTVLTQQMIKEGAPVLRKETGNGHPGRVMAIVGSPWQETHVRVEHIEHEKPFTFTKTILESAAAKAHAYGPDRVDSGTMVIATVLNGYETAKPFGKKVTKAGIVTLSSSIDREPAQTIRSILQKAYHTRSISLSGVAPSLYTVFRDLYPHQKDFLLLDVSKDATDALFVKHGILVGVTCVPHGIRELVSIRHDDISFGEAFGSPHADRTAAFGSRVEEAKRIWLDAMREVFAEFAKEHALPRTLFLIADPGSHEFLARLLDDEELRTLWLSDEPLAVTPALPEQFAPYLMTRGKAEPDLSLAIAALGLARREI